MDVLFAPSLSDAFPIVILEAMALGIPVVGSRVGGIPEIVLDRQTRLLVPPRDTAALADAVMHFACKPAKARAMGEEAKERALSNYHPSRFVARHESLHQQVAGSMSRFRSSAPPSTKKDGR